jgi:hypothetical protein
LRRSGISYAYLGKELGGRPGASCCYCDGIADYEKIAQTAEFKKGLERVIEGTRKFKIALMCSEQDPLDCHRCLLVGRALAERGVVVGHIQRDGAVTTQPQIEERLLELCGRSTDDLFASRDQRLLAAYRERGRKIAFADPQRDQQGIVAAE